MKQIKEQVRPRRARARARACATTTTTPTSTTTTTKMMTTTGRQPRASLPQLMEKEGIAAEQIRLIHNGKQLNDGESLESAKIEAGVTIHMVLALRGGAC